jgi:hypothetical protein
MRQGRPCTLSPRDFALLREWHAAGVPLAAVLSGIDRAGRAGEAVSLAYCRRFVEPPREATRPLAVDGVDAAADLLATLAELARAVADAGGPPPFERALRLIAELRDFMGVSREPNRRYLDGALHAIDEAVAEAALESLPEAEARGLLDEAEPALARQRGLAPGLRDEARRRHAARRARERLGLPRLSRDA